ncbi:hypothetical protein HanIR_Chr02g0087171 [Helianthus annuus]|nr:hypothetical protein HanIR_Chr02g0087171 [Helianthus annuus]
MPPCVNSCSPTQAPPYPMGVGLGLFSTCQLMPQTKPQLKPTIPHGLILIMYQGRCHLTMRLENIDV